MCDGKDKKTPKQDFSFRYSRGPSWFNLRGSRVIEIVATRNTINALMRGLMGLGLIGSVTLIGVNLVWARRVDTVIDVTDRKIRDWEPEAKDPSK